ncbi:fimbrial biogenesis chaperone [Vibrio sp. V39_P1S14PM300]|uniref:fimbrial biogenesis chaperone n=1 Tax=Vibrio sp. V39_P1S14PM300 TaxID=1938690 RepID=UPI001372F630|nr:molecular chaperone [Vibrio sp. V39_P1S14PM300]NAX23097.1 fimbria/pilus periplasmic chaperone [Vibrio sp. V39_P1S14PM300]
MRELLLKSSKQCCILIFIYLISVPAFAGLMLDKSRVIIYDNHPDHSAYVVNTNDYPVITQFWVTDEASEALPKDAKSPFLVVPPVAKLAPGEKKNMAIYYTGDTLNGDKEQLFWLNLHEAPPTANLDDNKVIVSMTTKIKLFLRPAHMEALAKGPVPKITCTQSKGKTRVSNTTPFYVNYLRLGTEDSGGYLPPFSTLYFNVHNNKILPMFYINDQGQIRHLEISCIKDRASDPK